MSDIKISVIIPIYNIKDYIADCITSVMNTGFDGLEIIAVDDGSRDESAKICDSFASDTVRVFHKENGGLSDARNFGLEKAVGKYVFFLDGDDRVLPETFSTLYELCESTNADIAVGKARLAKPSEAMARFERIAEERITPGVAISGKEYLSACLSGGALRVDVWRCLYRRDFLENNRLLFKKGIAHEDEEFTPRAFLSAKTVVTTPAEIYFYNNDRPGSIMNTASLKKISDRMNTYSELLSVYSGISPRRLRKLLCDDVSWKYIDCCTAMIKADTVADFDRFLPLKTAYKPKRRIKALAFAISPKLYSKHF